MEMERINKEKKDIEAMRKQADVFYQQTLKSTSYMPTRSKAPLTKPDKIKFATDERIKNTEKELKNDKEIDFTKILRDSKQKSVSKIQRNNLETCSVTWL